MLFKPVGLGGRTDTETARTRVLAVLSDGYEAKRILEEIRGVECGVYAARYAGSFWGMVTF